MVGFGRASGSTVGGCERQKGTQTSLDMNTTTTRSRKMSDSAEKKNRVRRLIRHFFKERDCCTLVRPTEEEEVIQNLSNVPEDMLRDEFNS